MVFTKDIKVDYGATGNGQVALTNVSITSGTNTLAVSTNIFVAGDVGKTILITGAGTGSGQLSTTISVFTNASHVTLADNALTTMTAQAMRLYWGTSDGTAFATWHTDAIAQGTTPCVLNIPAGVYLTYNLTFFYESVYDLTINMAGATLSDFSTGGAFHQDAVGVSSARVNQVNAGDTVISLITPAQTAIFTVGTWVCLASLELQGGGYPPNFRYFEYHKILAIGTGTITIDTAATYTHRTTYPVTFTTYDSGGPATLFNMYSTWDQTVVVNGNPGGVLDNNGQVNISARSITINDCTLYGRFAYIASRGVNPTESKEIVFNNCTTMLGVEVDKEVTSLTWNNCTVDLIEYQSASVTNTYVYGGTVGTLFGTSINTLMSACTVTSSIKLGCLTYGSPTSFAASNCSFASITVTNSLPRIDLATASYSSGVFSLANAQATLLYPAAVPGALAFWQASGALGDPKNWAHSTRITDIWNDATTTYVSISPALASAPIYLPGPSEIVATATTLGIVVHPAPNVTFSNCTGCADAIDLSQAGAGQPLYSYTKRTYVSGSIGTTSPFVNLWGKISFIKVTVNSAASGVGPLNVLRQFTGTPMVDSNNFWHRDDIFIEIDLTQTGVRLITPTAVTGAVGADNISFLNGWPVGGWMMYGMTPTVSTVIVGGSVTIEVATSQLPTDGSTTLYSLNSVW